jgi:hypothetical protein
VFDTESKVVSPEPNTIINGSYTTTISGLGKSRNHEEAINLIDEGLKRVRTAKQRQAALQAEEEDALKKPRVIAFLFDGPEARNAMDTTAIVVQSLGLEYELKMEAFDVDSEYGDDIDATVLYCAFVPKPGGDPTLVSRWDEALLKLITLLQTWDAAVDVKLSHVDFDEAMENLRKNKVYMADRPIYNGAVCDEE